MCTFYHVSNIEGIVLQAEIFLGEGRRTSANYYLIPTSKWNVSLARYSVAEDQWEKWYLDYFDWA